MSIQDDFTTNNTLEEEAFRLKIPLHFAWHKDSLTYPTKNGLYIINLADEDKPGSHWTCFWKQGTQCCYFDAFGFPAPKEVERFFKRYYYNDALIQDPNYGGCGSYCIQFGQYMNENKNIPVKKRYEKFLSQFSDDFKKNRQILRRLEKD